MSNENFIEKLEKIFKKFELALQRPPERSDGMIIYYIVHIVASLKTGEEDVAGAIKNWLTDNLAKLEKLHEELEQQGVLHKTYYTKHIQQVEDDLNSLLNPSSRLKIASGTDLNEYLKFVLDVRL